MSTAVIAIAFFIISNYLGASGFGAYSYAYALVTIFSVTSHAGLAGLVIKQLKDYPNRQGAILSSTLLIKYIGAFIGFILLSAYELFFGTGFQTQEYSLILIFSTSLIFKPLLVFDSWLQSSFNFKQICIANALGNAIYIIALISCVKLGLGITIIAGCEILRVALSLLIQFNFFQKISALTVADFYIEKEYTLDLLKKGLPIFVGSILAVIYLKVDIIMLNSFTNSYKDVGSYALSVQITNLFNFAPLVVSAAVFPKLVEIHKHNQDKFIKVFQSYIDILLILGVGIGFITVTFMPFISKHFFDSSFDINNNVIAVLSLANVFAFLRQALSKWILIKDISLFSLLTQGLGASLNVVMNTLLIPVYLGFGASIATLTSYAIGSFLILACFKETNELFRMLLYAFALPWRLICYSFGINRKV